MSRLDSHYRPKIKFEVDEDYQITSITVDGIKIPVGGVHIDEGETIKRRISDLIDILHELSRVVSELHSANIIVDFDIIYRLLKKVGHIPKKLPPKYIPDDVLWNLVEDLDERQKKLLLFLGLSEKTKKSIREELDLTGPELGGLMAGLTKKIEKFGLPQPLIETEEKDDTIVYRISPLYRRLIELLRETDVKKPDRIR